MIYGQTFAQSRISDILQKLSSGLPTPGFVLISGPSHIGKRSMLQECIKKECGSAPASDIYTLYDCSNIGEYENKTHTIKITTTEKGEIPTIVMPSGEKIYDYGTRELQSVLVISPIGKYKIVLIEHIERIYSSNAMLKILEEPLEHRIIIGTISSLSLLLPTIVSRAYIINCNTVDDVVVRNYLQDQHPTLSLSQIDIITQLSGGAIGIACKLAQKDKSDIDTLYCDCQCLLHGSLMQIYNTLQNYNQSHTIGLYLELAQSYCDTQKRYDIISHIRQYKKYSNASVKVENIILQLAIQLSKT